MIKSFRHKGLQKFFETGSTAGIQAVHSQKLRMRLAALETATSLNDIDIPGFRLHPLKGEMQEFWAITVSKNWRLTFQFTDGDVYFVNYEDYHS